MIKLIITRIVGSKGNRGPGGQWGLAKRGFRLVSVYLPFCLNQDFSALALLPF